MRIPQFTAEASIPRPHPGYRARPLKVDASGVVPSLPSAASCEYAATTCEQHPGSPACRLLKMCTGPIGSGGTGSAGAGWGDVASYAECSANCNYNPTCIDLFC